MTLAPEAPARVLRPSRVRCRVGTGVPFLGTRPFVPVVYPAGHTDQLIIAEAIPGSWGTRHLAEIRGARIGNPSWTFNGVGSLDFACSSWNDAMDHLVDPATVTNGAGVMKLIGREIQFWRDGVLRWGGPPITGRPKLDGTVDFSCMDHGYYIARKYFGAAERKDYLRSIGSMDRASLPGWTMTGGATKTQDTVDKARGTGSMVLSGSGAAQARFSVPARPVVPPMHLTVVAKVPTGTPVGTLVATITVKTSGGDTIDEASIAVTEDTMLGDWARASTYANQRVGVVNVVTITLWSPGADGDTKFDDVRSIENDTTGIPMPGADLARHAVAGLNHIQKGRGQAPGFGLRPEVVTTTGTVEVLGERHMNHIQFTDFLTRYTDRDDGFDWRIQAAGRKFQVAHRIGIDHETITLHDRSAAGGGWDHDESRLAAKVVVPGPSDGVDRPEGGYTDTSRTRGLMLDHFHQPPAGTPDSALDPMARQVWDEMSRPSTTFGELSISDDRLGEVEPGDSLPATLRSGKFRVPTDTRIRIGTMTLDREAGRLVLV